MNERSFQPDILLTSMIASLEKTLKEKEVERDEKRQKACRYLLFKEAGIALPEEANNIYAELASSRHVIDVIQSELERLRNLSRKMEMEPEFRKAINDRIAKIITE